MTFRWSSTLPAVDIMFHPDVPSRSGGLTITGLEQVVVSNAGRWRAKLSFNVGHGHGNRLIPGRLQDTVLAWRAFLASMEGRSNTFLIGPFDRANSPAAIAGNPFGPFSIPHDDGAFFADGAGYDQDATPAHAASGASIGATVIGIMMEAGHIPEPGQYFGLGGDRLYLIKSVTDEGGGEYELTFWPSLRAAASVNDPVNFDDPVCLMRMSADDVAELMTNGPLYLSRPSLDLVEASPES